MFGEERQNEPSRSTDDATDDHLEPSNKGPLPPPEQSQDGPSDIFRSRLATLFVKRSKAAEQVDRWDLALEDANKVIEIDPQSRLGHERKESIQYARAEYDRSILRTRAERKEAIRMSIREAIKNWPTMLINTHTGRGCNREQQELAFEDLAPFKEYLSSDTPTPDIRKSLVIAMKKYCRYIMLSHAWEGEDSVFDAIGTQSLYDLTSPPYVDKLQRFCNIVREAGCYWAWSDTSCLSAPSHGVVIERPRSLYDWYEHAWRTIVLLRGMVKPSLPVSVKNSVWITRSWTIYEYVAARFVWFYTDDWKPYHDLGTSNHKYAPIVVAEIQAKTNIPAGTLHKLLPGVTDVREKLQLAAPRQVTKPEDAAYSLCPLFDIPMQPKYDEGTDYAIGRLMEQIISRSGDVVVLDWIGHSGTYHSCLPGNLRPYNTPQYNVPSPVVNIPAYFPELDTYAILLYKRLMALDVPHMSDRRLRLPCIAFRVELQVVNAGVYRMKTRALKDVEVGTMDDLSTLSKNLVLVHPWIRALLGSTTPPTTFETLEGDASDELRSKALELAARLRQDFGALLLAEGSQNEYARVATDVSIRVQLLEDVSFDRILENVCVLDVT